MSLDLQTLLTLLATFQHIINLLLILLLCQGFKLALKQTAFHEDKVKYSQFSRASQKFLIAPSLSFIPLKFDTFAFLLNIVGLTALCSARIRNVGRNYLFILLQKTFTSYEKQKCIVGEFAEKQINL